MALYGKTFWKGRSKVSSYCEIEEERHYQTHEEETSTVERRAAARKQAENGSTLP